MYVCLQAIHLKGCNIHCNPEAVGPSIQGDGTSRGLDPRIYFTTMIQQPNRFLHRLS